MGSNAIVIPQPVCNVCFLYRKERKVCGWDRGNRCEVYQKCTPFPSTVNRCWQLSKCQIILATTCRLKFHPRRHKDLMKGLINIAVLQSSPLTDINLTDRYSNRRQAGEQKRAECCRARTHPHIPVWPRQQPCTAVPGQVFFTAESQGGLWQLVNTAETQTEHGLPLTASSGLLLTVNPN